MKKIISLSLTLLSSFAMLSQDIITTALTSEHREVEGTKISMIPPTEFTTADNFLGFQQTESGSSIMVLDIPAPFAEISKGFTEEGLRTQKMILIASENLTLNNKPAVFLHAEQEAYGNTYTKYILALGNETESILINGTFPKQFEELNAVIRKSLLSVVYNSQKIINPFDTVDFEITTDATEFVFATSAANSLLFTRDGKIPTESEDGAAFIIAKAFSELNIEDREAFAKNRIRQLPIKVEQIISTEPIEIDGLSGYEIIADGKDKKSGVKEKAYQVILFSDTLYYILFGSSQANFDTNIEVYRTLAKTFKRK